MSYSLDHRTIETAMRRARVQRAIAIRKVISYSTQGLRRAAHGLVAVFS